MFRKDPLTRRSEKKRGGASGRESDPPKKTFLSGRDERSGGSDEDTKKRVECKKTAIRNRQRRDEETGRGMTQEKIRLRQMADPKET